MYNLLFRLVHLHTEFVFRLSVKEEVTRADAAKKKRGKTFSDERSLSSRRAFPAFPIEATNELCRYISNEIVARAIK